MFWSCSQLFTVITRGNMKQVTPLEMLLMILMLTCVTVPGAGTAAAAAAGPGWRSSGPRPRPRPPRPRLQWRSVRVALLSGREAAGLLQHKPEILQVWVSGFWFYIYLLSIWVIWGSLETRVDTQWKVQNRLKTWESYKTNATNRWL